MKIREWSGVFCFAILLAGRAPATTHYVDLNSPGPASPFLTWATAATNIQDAVDSAVSGDTVLVTNGVYQTGGHLAPQIAYQANLTSNRVTITNAISVQSVNGAPVTIIRGYQVPGGAYGATAVRGAYLVDGASLVGFTITNGATGDYDGGKTGDGGGIWCLSTNCLISNCVVAGNLANNSGGGVSGGTLMNCLLVGNACYSDGGGANQSQLISCTLTNNHSDAGGGACSSTLLGCTLAGNLADNGGGACLTTLNNCFILGNSSDISEGGGGTDSCVVSNCFYSGNFAGWSGGADQYSTLRNCILSNNTANTGTAAYASTLYSCLIAGNIVRIPTSYGAAVEEGTMYNCTVLGNTGGIYGGGVADSTVHNSIVCSNQAQNPLAGFSNYYNSTFDYSCVAPLPPGLKNFANDPLITDAFHLAATSPCRGAGSAAYAKGSDLEGEAWLNPPSVGCDEVRGHGPLTVTAGADNTEVAAGFSINFSAWVTGSYLSSKWDFGDGTIVSNVLSLPHRWVTGGIYNVTFSAMNADHPGGVTTNVAIQIISPAVGYVSLTSTNPVPPFNSWATAATNIQDALDLAVPGGTILVSNGVYETGGRDVFQNGLSRVTVTNALTLKSVNGPAVTIIKGCQVPGTTTDVGPVRCAYLADGAFLAGFTLTNGATSTNSEEPDSWGGGVSCQSFAVDTPNSATISNCIIIGNSSFAGGGAAGGILTNCVLTGNTAWECGGAVGSLLGNCLISSNFASICSAAGVCIMYNCLSTANQSTPDLGSTLFQCWMTNCTVAGNTGSGEYGGGTAMCVGANCIVFFNSGGDDSGSSFDYTCISTNAGYGTGIITNAPLFVDMANGNYRLQSNSPCINAGFNADSPAGVDLDGRPRVVGGTVDMGAYEFQGPGLGEFIGWLQQYGLPTDGSADNLDSDGDGMSNWAEWRAGTNPTDSASVLSLMPPVGSGTNLLVTWQSVTNTSYYLQRSLGLTPAAFETVATNISGQPLTTVYTDTNAPQPGPWFYRVGVQ